MATMTEPKVQQKPPGNFDLLGALFGGNPYQPWDPLGAGWGKTGITQDQFGYQYASPEESTQFHSFLNQAGLDDATRNAFASRYDPHNQAGNYQLMNEIMAASYQAFQRDQAEDARAAADAARASGLASVNQLESTYKPIFEGQLNRFQDSNNPGQLRDGFIFNDQEYGSLLGQAEAAINRGAATSRNNAAIANMNAGVRGSGKQINMAGASELDANARRADVRAGLGTEAMSRMDQLIDRNRQFDTDIGRMRTEAEQGFIPNALGIGQYYGQMSTPDWYAPRQAGLNETFAGRGQSLNEASLGVNAGLGLLGAANNTLSSTYNFIRPGR